VPAREQNSGRKRQHFRCGYMEDRAAARPGGQRRRCGGLTQSEVRSEKSEAWLRKRMPEAEVRGGGCYARSGVALIGNRLCRRPAVGETTGWPLALRADGGSTGAAALYRSPAIQGQWPVPPPAGQHRSGRKILRLQVQTTRGRLFWFGPTRRCDNRCPGKRERPVQQLEKTLAPASDFSMLSP